jgi:hypothetical protein
MVTGYRSLIDSCQNHPKDRHVLAAAIHSKTETIVTFNAKDFKPEALDPWGISAAHPAEYLKVLFDHDQAVVVTVLHNMAEKADRSFPEMLARLAWYVMPFSKYVATALAIDLPDIPPIEWRRSVRSVR